MNIGERNISTVLAFGTVAIIAMLCLATVNFAISVAPQPLRVACVGDSITVGGYPLLLQTKLGYSYEVKNFGVSGATVTKDSVIPYMDQPEFEEALEFEPDIVVVMLGTNDANPQIAHSEDNFVSDYTQLIQSFQKLEGSEQIWLVKSPPIFADDSAYNNTYLSRTVLPQIETLADQLNLPTIDVNSVCINYSNYFNDGIHPNNDGSELIAENIYDAITARVDSSDDHYYINSP